MPAAAPQEIFLKDYQEPCHWIETVELDFDLAPGETTIKAKIAVRRHADASQDTPLVLNGEDINLISVMIDGVAVPAGQYEVSTIHLTLQGPLPETFELETQVTLSPEENTSLSGLYVSGELLCTQCEAEGFRRITYYPDRPDVMATFKTKIHASKATYPILLSNGNCIASGDHEDGRHWAEWEDPFPKPAYLFALVAGELDVATDVFTRASGRDVDLRIYVEPGKLDQTDFAMRALKASMAWDETKYGLEYDLDIFMIVAVSTFNMGAMENKGLNIFNDSCVLANPEIATDRDYKKIESIVAHEYFHNWTGNRITCRNWFQLCLKEGLTVFRDQQFSEDMQSAAVERIESVLGLRAGQYPEDDGALAHPVRPEAFIEIDNFYTSTVYEKGAELCRMVHTIVGDAGFRIGIDLYFARHDGQAATVEEFLAAMADANDADLTQFSKWYAQAGRPVVSARVEQNLEDQTVTVSLSQSTAPTPGDSAKQPMHIPVRVGLVGKSGDELSFNGEETEVILDLVEEEQSFTLEGVTSEAVPSLLRGFSAPVDLKIDLSHEDRALLMASDSDTFNRWEAGRTFALDILSTATLAISNGKITETPSLYLDALKQNLNQSTLDPALRALTLQLPSESELGTTMDMIRVEEIHQARRQMQNTIAEELGSDLETTYRQMQTNEPYAFTTQDTARRALKNASLLALTAQEDPARLGMAAEQFNASDNMTDTVAALRALTDTASTERDESFEAFEAKWADNPLVLDKWFSLQSISQREGTFELVQKLMSHPSFNMKNPNRVRSLLGSFFYSNQLRFHDASGQPYDFFGDQVLDLDKINPILASRLLSELSNWRKFDEQRQRRLHDLLERILRQDGLSKNSYEIASKTLGDP